MSFHKGPDLVSEAHHAAFPNAEIPIQFYGSGGIKLPHHTINPPLPNHMVFEHLQKADALVMGSRWAENAPLVINEARAVGCPIVAPKIGGIPELVKDGVDGILFTPGDKNSLTSALATLTSRTFKVRPPPSEEDQLKRYLSVYRSMLQ